VTTWWETVIVGPAADAFLEVGTFVAVALALFGLLRWRLGERLPAWMARHRRRGPLAGALLGVVPGCGGAIVVMPLYLQGQVSFGTVVATLTATMGDSSFVLLAADPLLALAVHAGLLAVGVVTGVAVDTLGLDPRAGAERLTPRDAEAVLPSPPSTVGAAAAPLGLLGRPTARRPLGLAAFWTLTTVAFAVAVPVVLQLTPPASFDLGPIPTATVLGAAGALLCLTLTVLGRGPDRSVAACADRPRAVLTEAVRETAPVVTWVAVAFVGYEALVATTGIDIGALPTIGLIGVLAGALLGVVPGCGPQLVLTGLYAQGALPVSVLVANALSQDGDALFPLIAGDRRAAVLATGITVLPGVLAGGGLALLGL
jgi:hypothetical protein